MQRLCVEKPAKAVGVCNACASALFSRLDDPVVIPFAMFLEYDGQPVARTRVVPEHKARTVQRSAVLIFRHESFSGEFNVLAIAERPS